MEKELSSRFYIMSLERTKSDINFNYSYTLDYLLNIGGLFLYTDHNGDHQATDNIDHPSILNSGKLATVMTLYSDYFGLSKNDKSWYGQVMIDEVILFYSSIYDTYTPVHESDIKPIFDEIMRGKFANLSKEEIQDLNDYKNELKQYYDTIDRNILSEFESIIDRCLGNFKSCRVSVTDGDNKYVTFDVNRYATPVEINGKVFKFEYGDGTESYYYYCMERMTNFLKSKEAEMIVSTVTGQMLDGKEVLELYSFDNTMQSITNTDVVNRLLKYKGGAKSSLCSIVYCDLRGNRICEEDVEV